jgi:hypothetical protein
MSSRSVGLLVRRAVASWLLVVSPLSIEMMAACGRLSRLVHVLSHCAN